MRYFLITIYQPYVNQNGYNNICIVSKYFPSVDIINEGFLHNEIRLKDFTITFIFEFKDVADYLNHAGNKHFYMYCP